ncbi:MAG: protease modulator HflC [Gammaproteobacteria bacterium]|nr:protease modulator HflC [Gammaproteobacteria bacterium]
MRVFTLFAIAIAVGLIVSSLFIVDERQLALRFKFGEIVQTDYESGLHWKLPPPFNTVVRYEDRILTTDNRPELFLTGETKYVEVDFFIKWRIVDAREFYLAFRDNAASAQNRLLEIVTDGMKDEFANRTIQEVVSAERSELMDRMLVQTQEVAANFGVEVVDVRVKRIDLPGDVSGSVYDRMRQERGRIAAELRAEGEQASEEIRATAERQRTILLAEAYRDAQKTRGEGDAQAAAIYASAYNRNREFYAFYRSMQAYRNALGDGDDILLLKPDSEFFRYLNESGANP